MSGDTALQRAHAYLEDARDTSIGPAARCETLDSARSALLDARRARVQPELLLPIFKDICTTAASDSAYLVRSIVPRTVEDLCLREMKIFIPIATPFLVRSLHDNHVLVAKRAVRALTILFRKLIGYVVSVGVSEKTFPEARLSAWLQMQTKAISLIHAQDEGLRKAATKFAETVILAFSYSGGPGSQDHFTLDYALKHGSTCPLLNVTALEEEGVRCVDAVAKLIHSGLDGNLTTIRPDGSSMHGLLPLSFMTAISVLSNLSRRRRKLLSRTLPPLLLVVAAITGSTRPPSPHFHSLTEGQKLSIVSVLRFSILALRAYPHTRTGRAGTDINLAINDLSNYEKEEEYRRKERASTKPTREIQQNIVTAVASTTAVTAAVSAEALRNVPTLIHEQQPTPTPAPGPEPVPQRPHQPDPGQPWPRPPAKDSFVIAQTLSRSMPHKEVVNFIMTRLLLNIPPPATVPGAVRPRNLQSPSVPTDEPSQKRLRRSRFGTRDDVPVKQASAAPKKVVAVRKVAPPVFAAKLSSEAACKLVTLCCRRVMKRESEAIVSGAGPLRIQLLTRLLTSLARAETQVSQAFCDEACSFITDGIGGRVELALAWLHGLFFQEEFATFKPNSGQLEKPKISSSYIVAMPALPEELDPTAVEGKAERMETESLKAEDKFDVTKVSDSKVESQADGDVIKPSMNGNGKEERHSDMNDMEVNKAPLTENQVEATTSNSTTQQKEEHEDVNADKSADEYSDGNAGENANENEAGKTDGNIEDVFEYEEHEPLVAGAAYERVFIKLLLLLKERSEVPAEVFSRMVTEAPLLPPSVIEALDGLCRDASCTKLGLQTLRDIVVERSGGDRQRCMTLLLEYTFDKDEVLRGPAIRLVANGIFVECSSEVSQLIEDHAVRGLLQSVVTLSETCTLENVSLLERSSLLLTALCGQKHELLVSLATAYAQAPAEGRKVLLHRAKDLAGHLGMSARPILELIGGNLLPVQSEGTNASSRSDKVEELALEVLRALLNKFGKPTNDIVEAACRRYEMKNDTNFIIAVLPGLRREALVRYLAAVVETSVRSGSPGTDILHSGMTNGERDEAKSTVGFKEVVSSVMNARPPTLSPAELLVELHKIKPTAAVSTAIRACFEVKIVYKQEAVAQAVQQLMEMTVTPDLLMRTVHLARIFHPELERYLTGTVMKRLIEKKVWMNKLLWEGFLRYCAEIKEKSLKLLLSLPTTQLEDALETEPVLTSVFKDLVSNPKSAKKIQAKHKKIISAAIKKSSRSKT